MATTFTLRVPSREADELRATLSRLVPVGQLVEERDEGDDEHPETCRCGGTGVLEGPVEVLRDETGVVFADGSETCPGPVRPELFCLGSNDAIDDDINF